jgi:hypothetical protein
MKRCGRRTSASIAEPYGEAGRGFLAKATTGIARPLRRALLWQPHVGGCLIFVASGP